MRARASVRVRVLPPLPVESLGSDEAALATRVRALYLEALGLPAGSGEDRKQECA
jgi:hypothetical protein